MEKAWRVGLDEFSDEQVRGEPFQNQIRASMKRVVDQIEQMPHDEEKFNAIKAVIAALDAPPASTNTKASLGWSL